MSTQKKQTEKRTYDSNPFTLAFNALGRLFNANAGWAIALIVLSMLGFISQLFSNAAQLAMTDTPSSSEPSFASAGSTPLEPAVIAAIIIFVFVGVLIFIAISLVVDVYVKGMLSYVALASEEERSVSFGEAFQAVTKRFWRLLGAQLLAGLKIFGWTLLLVVPGIIAALRYSLLPYVIMAEPETEKGITSSHAKTKETVRGRLMEVFGVKVVESLIPIIGTVAGLSGRAALYNQLSAYNEQGLDKPKVHWLNYLGFILIGVILFFLLGILAIIALVAISSAR